MKLKMQTELRKMDFNDDIFLIQKDYSVLRSVVKQDEMEIAEYTIDSILNKLSNMKSKLISFERKYLK